MMTLRHHFIAAFYQQRRSEVGCRGERRTRRFTADEATHALQRGDRAKKGRELVVGVVVGAPTREDIDNQVTSGGKATIQISLGIVCRPSFE